jgi:hypothetical protein
MEATTFHRLRLGDRRARQIVRMPQPYEAYIL